MAAETWAALTHLLAGRPVIRVSKDRRTYPRRWQRPLTEQIPTAPAAIPVYRKDGTTRLLVVDLDTGRGPAGQVDRDHAAITKLARESGAAIICDRSPTGGRHIYIPLAQPIPFHTARAWALDMAAQYATVDPQPMLGLTDGLIRPPGSPHKTGGHQRLDAPLTSAVRVATAGNPARVWRALRAATPARHSRCDRAAAAGGPDLDRGVPLPRGPRDLPPDYRAIAHTGRFDTSRYRSPSEARAAVVTAAVWAGMTLTGLAARIDTGAWPGLASLYARYRPHQRSQALTRDWRKAVGWVRKHQADSRGHSGVHQSTTSKPSTHARRSAKPAATGFDDAMVGSSGEYGFVRRWWAAMAVLERARFGADSACRMVLRALGEAALKTGSRRVAFGVRSLAVASGMDHTTVAAVLCRLRSEHDPLLVLVEGGRGLRGDLYELRIPSSASGSDRPPRAGRIHALRPAFRELGRPAALVYEVLEGAGGAVSSMTVVAETGLSRAAVYGALETLAAFDLAVRVGGGWRVGGASLAILADALGCTAQVDAQVERYRVERDAYRRFLVSVLERGGRVTVDVVRWARRAASTRVAAVAGLGPPG